MCPYHPSFSADTADTPTQGWFLFTTLLLVCTLRSTVAFFLLFFTLDMAFLLLGIGYLERTGGTPNTGCIHAGGVFALLAAFLVRTMTTTPIIKFSTLLTNITTQAWYNALAGIADSSNSFFLIPVAHFPWSDKGREKRTKVDNSEARAQEGV